MFPQANSDTEQSIIFAFGTTNPGSSDESATLQQHLDSGVTSLDLTKPFSASSTPSGSDFGSSSSADPWTHYRRMVVAHAVLSVVGFALLLPCGILLARYLRTFTPTWYTGHWIAQFGIGKAVSRNIEYIALC
jgi:hypothetical protein